MRTNAKVVACMVHMHPAACRKQGHPWYNQYDGKCPEGSRVFTRVASHRPSLSSASVWRALLLPALATRRIISALACDRSSAGAVTLAAAPRLLPARPLPARRLPWLDGGPTS